MFREFGTGLVGKARPKDLPDEVTPIYSQTAWFILAQDVAVDLEAIYGIPHVIVQGTDFYITK
ncbi:hypothetical protein [Enterococcus gallinarum]|uniref:hypothetical protein n=1 Tax=Enterococcus gallinarum TaxID=1353 RepID=UPI000913C92E|nr:hypothetical protein [Enterococcus gallinarum]OJG47380.1 hypothetical protein RV03_GL002208 [Enterococcus gallinarum]